MIKFDQIWFFVFVWFFSFNVICFDSKVVFFVYFLFVSIGKVGLSDWNPWQKECTFGHLYIQVLFGLVFSHIDSLLSREASAELFHVFLGKIFLLLSMESNIEASIQLFGGPWPILQRERIYMYSPVVTMKHKRNMIVFDSFLPRES